jgi:hypothetical protein
MAARITPAAGRKPDKFMRDALILALHRAAVDCDGKPTRQLNNIADALVRKAAEGDVGAIKEVFDRVEGKAIQATEISGPDGSALTHNLTISFVSPK